LQSGEIAFAMLLVISQSWDFGATPSLRPPERKGAVTLPLRHSQQPTQMC
jgi:hypothetical protein